MTRKTLILWLFGAFAGVFLSPATAATSGAVAQTEAIAICSGRLEALAAWHRNSRHPNAPETTAVAQNFTTLLDAALPGAMATGIDDKQPLRWHARGWTDISRPVSAVVYGDARRARVAKGQIARAVATCQRMILR